MGVWPFVAKKASDYFFRSKQYKWALLCLAGVFLGTIGLAVLSTIGLTWGTTLFFAALQAMSLPLFIESLEILVAMYISAVALTSFTEYLIGLLIIDCQNWFMDDYLNKLNALKLKHEHFKFLGARFTHDLGKFVEKSFLLWISFLRNALLLPPVIGLLWILGGAITLAIPGFIITIPGYMVWLTILFATASYLANYKMGQSMPPLMSAELNLKANLQADIDFIDERAEDIALQKQEQSYIASLKIILNDMKNNANKLLLVKAFMNGFNNFIDSISWCLPYIFTAPQYFAGKINLGQVSQIVQLFSQASASLNWFSNFYEEFSIYKTLVTRIVELETALENKSLEKYENISIVHRLDDDKNMYVRGLNIKAYPFANDLSEPSKSNYIMRDLNLTFNKGENVLIKAKSGMGKSTLKKVLAGTYSLGEGEISLPQNHRIRFFSQMPVMRRNDTLREFLSGTQAASAYTELEYKQVLKQVKVADDFGNKLDQPISKLNLSAGQQQRLALAQVLLEKDNPPDWLFLDEATASVDEGKSGEDLMYRLLQEKFKHATFISIAHRSTVAKFHHKEMILKKNNKGSVTVEEKWIAADHAIIKKKHASRRAIVCKGGMLKRGKHSFFAPHKLNSTVEMSAQSSMPILNPTL